MILDGIDIGLGDVVITDSKARKNGIEIPINCIDVYNGNHNYRFTFWTQREFHEYNELPLNEKVNVMDMIDDYDIDFASRNGNLTINTRENAELYFTRIAENKYIVNATINDLSKSVVGHMENKKTLELEAIIDFVENHE